jgi:3-dehydroquinate synthase
MKKSIEIKTATHRYEAVAGKDIFEDEIAAAASRFPASSLFILMDENVSKHHRKQIEGAFIKTGRPFHIKLIPEGESSKSADLWLGCIDFLLSSGVTRNSPVFVIGGGVTGDLGGFAAASVMRGVPLYHIPTTVLAMVDSSIGGKTGINHEAGKNLVGAFYQPERVIADITFLDSLPRQEWTNGLSEILKYGAIKQGDIFEKAELFLHENPDDSHPDKLVEIISDCIRIKADIVQEDEFEGGIRAFLNFGHTFAHALEKACGYQKMSHGEAVYLGMLAAVELSRQFKADIVPDNLTKFRQLYHYRVSKEELSLKDLTEYMKFDKKRTNQHIRFVLLEDWQQPVLKEVESETLIHKAWQIAFDEL